MTDTCIFCGATGTDFKPEHWVSQWISRATLPPGHGVQHHAPGRSPWISRRVDFTVEHVCSHCNHHWMSDMETRTRDIALPLIQGQPQTLGRLEQERLAAWCFLKAITSELGRSTDEKPTYPGHVYRGFKEFRYPPNACLILLGFREISGQPPIFMWFNSQGRQHAIPELNNPRGYRTAITIGHLVIDVLGVLDGRTKVETDPDARLVQLWPIASESLDWPPAERFKGIANDDLV